MATAYNYSKRFCPVIRTGSILQPRVRFQFDSCCPPKSYTITQPTVDANGVVQFASTYPMFDTDMYQLTMTNNQPANLLTMFKKYFKNSQYGYDSGVLAYPGTQFYITVTPYQDNIPRTSYTIPFTTLTPEPSLLLTGFTISGASTTLQWLVPESDQYVSTITSYNVRYDASSAVVPTNSIVINGLSPGSHTISVQGSNMAGVGIRSISFAFTT
jgi:hypothetical protein